MQLLTEHHAPIKTPRRRAFSLIEAAIVLAIIGLVVSGIWIASSTVSENRRYSHFSEQVILTIQNIRAMYRNTPVNSDVWLTDFANNGVDPIAKMGLAPSDMFSGSRLVDPWGNQVVIMLPANSTQQDQIIVHFTNLTIDRCIRLWWEFAIGKSAQMTGWLSSSNAASSPLYIWQTEWGPATTPLTSSQCSTGGYITMVFKRS